MKLGEISQKISVARSEFQSTNASVYGRFVVPPYFDRFDLSRTDHSVTVEGSRGSGKTTFLRYFSHWTQFDKTRPEISSSALKAIFIYWKPDTVFCRSINPSWLGESGARNFFLEFFALEVVKDLVSAVDNISHHYPILAEHISSGGRFLTSLSNILERKVTSLADAIMSIEELAYKVSAAININKTEILTGKNPKAALELLVSSLKRDSDIFADSKFRVLIDEFENLSEFQQKIINGYRKGSNLQLSWNVAYKTFAQISTATDSEEHVQEQADYRSYVLDNAMDRTETYIFNSEVFLLSLMNSGLTCLIPNFSSDILGDPLKLHLRDADIYRQQVTDAIKKILPGPSRLEMAKIAININTSKKLIMECLTTKCALDRKQAEHIMQNFPDAAVATYVLANQKSFSKEELTAYVESEGVEKKFKQKIDTYLYSAILYLNKSSYINIPAYSGFARFKSLAGNNIRFFFELCYQSFRLVEDGQDIFSLEDIPSVAPEISHKGAIAASGAIIKEIPTYAPSGQALMGLTRRLGDIFEILQRSPAQAQPEQNHFFIESDFGALPEDITTLLRQAKTWRVLLEFDTTKDKASDGSGDYEYQLNPIFSPFFGISYRKNRRVQFMLNEFRDIAFGEVDEYKKVRGKFLRTSRIDNESSGQESLFL